MAVFRFSALSDGQSLAFNPTTDVLNFDQTTVAAADLRVTQVGTNIRIDVVSGTQAGKDVTLQNVSPLQLATANVTFADGSKLLFGDNSTAQNDNLANSLTGTAGNDLLQGFGGADTMNGGAGNDTYIVSTGDVLSDSSGVDTVLSDVSWTLADGFENLTLTGTANADGTGNNGANLLIGNSARNFFNPRGGDDTIQAGAGDDWVRLGGGSVPGYGTKVIDGGSGVDTLEWGAFAKSAIVVDLAAGTLRGGDDGTGSASLVSIETVIGADGFDDRISGAAAAESLLGGTGNDTLDGRGGNDTLTGGLGADTFAFSTTPGAGNADQVTDFISVTNKLSFDNTVFTALGSAGNFVAGDARFAAGAGFTSGHDASDRIVYDTTTGNLYYDADGNGAGAAQLVATLQGHPSLAATDITVSGTAGSSIQGTAGNDTLTGTEGNDTIDGLAGNDALVGSHGADLLRGGDGDDTLDGATDFTRDFTELTQDANGQPLPGDTLDGGLGNDVFEIQFNDVIVDAGGIDTVRTDQDVYTLPDGFENLTYQPFEFSDGEGIGVSYVGNALDNTIRVQGLFVNSGADIDGGDGNDLLISGASNDRLLGGRGNDTLMGGGSDFDGDSYSGGDGDDRLVSVGTHDTLSGGNGADSFVFASAPGMDDPSAPRMISDFVSGTDKIVLDGFVHPNSGSSGNFTADDARFFAAPGASTAHDATDRVIYNTSTGELFYDADGTGEGAALLITHLGPGVTLVATDIAVENGNAGIAGTAGDDSLTGSEGNDSISGLAGNDTLNGLGGDDTLDGGAGDDSLIGGDGFDLLSGHDGNDTLDGGGGNDTLSGVDGADSFVFRGAGAATADHVIDFATGSDKIHLDASVLTGLGADGNFSAGDARLFAGAGANAAHDADDRVIFNTSTGQLWYDGDGTGAGDPALIGTFTSGIFGAVTQVNAADIVVDNGSGQAINGTAGNDSLTGTNGTDSINGLAGNDTINALGGNDTIDGGSGVDSMIGGLGDDLYFVDNLGDVTLEQAGGGNDTVDASVSYTLGAFVDNLTLIGSAPINGTGNELDNIITGNLANNALSGGAGNDTLLGQPAGIDPSDGDDTLDGAAGNDSLDGGYGSDRLIGGDGNDTLIAGPHGLFVPGDTGVDTLDGGLGDDFYQVVNDRDVLIDAGGIDTVVAIDLDWTLGAGFENLTLANGVGEFGQTGIGNELDNVMSVGFADSRLEGRGGNDTLIGGLIFNGGARGLDGGAGNDVLTGRGESLFIFDQAPGTANADVITDFQSGDSTLELDARVMTALGASGQLAADDARFFAAAGATGGHDADDRVIFNTSTGQVFYDADGSGAGAGQLIVTLQPGATLAASDIVVDNGSTPGSTITGTAGNDSLTGTAGDDTLDGGAGVDTMNGGLGNDTYIVTAGDVLSDTGGVDTVQSSVTWALADGFENLTLTGTGIVDATGNNAANLLIGNSARNFFNPRGGDDTIQGGGGNDWVRMGGGSVPGYGTKVIDGGSGVDTLEWGAFAKSAIVVDLAAGTLRGGDDGTGSASLTSIETVIGADGFDDRISGAAAAESLLGGTGNDTLDGRGGNDSLTGGAGADTFVFDTPPGTGNVDQVTDFVSASDHLSFDNAVFTALGANGNFAAGDARFAAGAGFTSGHDASDRVVYDTSTGNLYYDADGNGAGAAQLVATIQGHPAVAATDIAVI